MISLLDTVQYRGSTFTVIEYDRNPNGELEYKLASEDTFWDIATGKTVRRKFWVKESELTTNNQIA